MIKIVKDLPEFIFCNNPDEIECIASEIFNNPTLPGGITHSSDYYTNTIELDPASLGSGGIWNLKFNTTEINLNLIAGFSDNANDIPKFVGTYGLAFIIWMGNLEIFLNNHPLLADKFKFSLVPTSTYGHIFLKYTALEKGSNFILNTNYTGTTITVNNIDSAYGGMNNTLKSDYAVKMKLYIEEELYCDNWKLIGEYSGFGTENSELNTMKINFPNIGNSIKPYLEYNVPNKAYGFNIHTNQTKYFKYKIWEEWTDNSGEIIYSKMMESEKKLAVLAGLPLELRPYHDHARKIIFDEVNQLYNNLSYLPNNRTIHKDALCWINFLYVNTLPTSVIMQITVTDVSGIIRTDITNIDTFLKGQYVSFAIGNHISQALFSVDCTNISFVLLDDTSTPISQEITINIDYSTIQNEQFKNIVFMNSLGGVESFNIIEKTENKLSVEYSLSESIDNDSKNTNDGLLKANYIRTNNSLKMNTNYLDNSWKNTIEDFITSKIKLLVNKINSIEESIDYSSLNLSNGESQLPIDYRFGYKFSFEVSEAYSNTNWADNNLKIANPYYRDSIEMDLIIYEVLGGSVEYDLTLPSSDYKLFINNKLFTGHTITINEKGIYKIKIIGNIKQLFFISMNYSDVSDKLNLVKWQAPNISVIFLKGFDEVNTYHLISVLKKCLFLEAITISTISDSLQLDSLLAEIAAFKIKFLDWKLTDIDLQFTNPAPDTLGIESKAWLNANGITTLTN